MVARRRPLQDYESAFVGNQSEETHLERCERQKHERRQRAERRAQQQDEQSRVGEAKKRERGKVKAGFCLIDKLRVDKFPLEDKLVDRQQLLSKLEKYNERFSQRNSFKPEHDSNIILQVKDMTREQVIEEIEKYEQGSTSYRGYRVPSRSPSNIGLDSRRGYVVKRRKLILRNPKTRKYLATRIILGFILDLCRDDITTEIRMIYYRRRDLFKSVDSVSAIIDDICCMIGCTRSSLHVTASEKGVVIGNITFKVGEIVRNGNDGGKKGISIPSMNGDVSIMKDTDALYMIIIEKHTVYSRLAEDEFHKNYRCIMITARGMPDVDSRRFVNQASCELQIPVYSLNDFNPYGMKIASVFRFGSKNMSYDNENLATPNIRLLGILHKHLKKYPLPANVRLKMNHHDRKIAKRLLDRDHLGEWDEELKFMLKTGIKLELEAFCAFSFRYLSKVFLHLELQSLCDHEKDVHELCKQIELQSLDDEEAVHELCKKLELHSIDDEEAVHEICKKLELHSLAGDEEAVQELCKRLELHSLGDLKKMYMNYVRD